MTKIKDIFSKMLESVQSAFYNFPITIVLVFIYTMILAFAEDVLENETMQHISVILVFGMVGTLFSEVLFSEDKQKKYIGTVVSFIISIAIDRISEYELMTTEALFRWTSAYCVVCVGVALYLLSKQNDNVEKYILNTFLNIKKNTIIYAIVVIGVLALYSIFCALIGDLDYDVFAKFLILFTGGYYVPVILNSFIKEDAEDTKFNKTLFTKVFLILLCAAMIIIYIYIFKLMFITGIPENEVFRILSWIFACMLPICVVNKNYMGKDEIFNKTIKIIPILYIPFIFLQVYTMGIRISDYGLTEERYFAIMLILFEIISISMVSYKNSRYLRELIFVAIGICLISLISPLNYEAASIVSQERILSKYVKAGTKLEDLEKADQKKYAGSYQYLKRLEDYEFKVEINGVEKELLSEYSDFYSSVDYVPYNDNYYEETRSVYDNYEKLIDGVDISEYCKIYKFDKYLNNYKYDNREIEDNSFLKTEIETTDGSLTIDIDLSEFVNEILKANQKNSVSGERVFKEKNLVKIDKDRDLYIETFNINYNDKTNIVSSLRMTGFVLERK